MVLTLRAGLWAALMLCMWRQAVAHKQPSARSGMSENNQMGAILERLQSLDSSVGELKQQMAQLMQMQQGLQETCGARGGDGGEPGGSSNPGHEGSTTTQGTTTSPDACPERPGTSDFQITAVMKRETETQHVVTLCYVGPQPNSVEQQLRVNGNAEPLEVDGVGRVTTLKEKTNVSHDNELIVTFTFDYSQVTLLLDLTRESPDEFYFEKKLHLKVDHSQVAYSPGRAVQVASMLTNELNDSMVEYLDVSTHLLFKSSTEENTVEHFTLRPDVPIPEGISDVSLHDLGRQYGNATAYQILDVPTTPERQQGLILVQASLMLTCPDRPCLVHWLSMGQRVVFAPRGGPLKPFPDNFVGFPRWILSNPVDPDDPDRVQCYEGNRVRNCYLPCRAYGDSPQVNLTRAISNTPTSAHSDMRHDDEYTSFQLWDFENPVFSDAGPYLCQARSAYGGQEVSRVIQLSVDKVAEIQYNLTTVTVGDDGSITAVCTAQGRPTPSVRFGPYFGEPPTEVIEHADVHVVQINATTVYATFILANWTAYDSNDMNNVYCFAENLPHHEDYMHMPLVVSA